jgi:hypothetical protein
MTRHLVPSIAAAFRLLLLLVPAAAVALFLAGVTRGFDFTDEGFYYLSFAHPENVSDNQTSFFIFGAKLFALTGHSIVAMRLCTLAAMLGGTLLFLRGVGQFTAAFAPALSSDRERRLLVLGSALSASLLGFAISPPALSYNFQNACCLLAASGFLLDACSRPRTAVRLFDLGTIAPLAVFGALVGLEFFIKFSSSLPLAVGGFVLFLLVGRQTIAQKAGAAGALLLCAGLIGAIYFGCFQDMHHWQVGIFGTFSALRDGGYARTELLRYGREFRATYAALAKDFSIVWIVAAIAFGGALALRGAPRWQARWAFLAGVGVLGCMLGLILPEYLFGMNEAATSFYSGTLLLLAGVAVGSGLARRDFRAPSAPATWRAILAAGFLFFLPYVGAFGTNNAIHLNCLYQLAPWFVLAGWLLAALDHVWHSSWPSRLGLLLLTAVAAGQFYEGYWIRPYRAGGERPDMIGLTELGYPRSTLGLAAQGHEFVVAGRQALEAHGFRPGDDLLVFFNLPGFVFAMGGASPGHPWYFQGSPRNYDLDLMRLNFIPVERRRRAFIVRNSVEKDWTDFQPYLRQAGLNFPEDYTLISPPMTSPLTRVPVEIWAPRARLAAPVTSSPGK